MSSLTSVSMSGICTANRKSDDALRETYGFREGYISPQTEIVIYNRKRKDKKYGKKKELRNQDELSLHRTSKYRSPVKVKNLSDSQILFMLRSLFHIFEEISSAHSFLLLFIPQ